MKAEDMNNAIKYRKDPDIFEPAPIADPETKARTLAALERMKKNKPELEYPAVIAAGMTLRLAGGMYCRIASCRRTFRADGERYSAWLLGMDGKSFGVEFDADGMAHELRRGPVKSSRKDEPEILSKYDIEDILEGSNA